MEERERAREEWNARERKREKPARQKLQGLLWLNLKSGTPPFLPYSTAHMDTCGRGRGHDTECAHQEVSHGGHLGEKPPQPQGGFGIRKGGVRGRMQFGVK